MNGPTGFNLRYAPKGYPEVTLRLSPSRLYYARVTAIAISRGLGVPVQIWRSGKHFEEIR